MRVSEAKSARTVAVPKKTFPVLLMNVVLRVVTSSLLYIAPEETGLALLSKVVSYKPSAVPLSPNAPAMHVDESHANRLETKLVL